MSQLDSASPHQNCLEQPFKTLCCRLSAEADRVKTVNKAKVKKMRTEIQEADAAGTISFFVWWVFRIVT